MKFWTLSIALLLGACTVGPDFRRPELPSSRAWREAKASAGTHLPDTWWRLFGDANLNRLVERALAANPDLAAARARVATAHALVGVDRARLWPRLDFSGSASISRASQNAATAGLPPGIPIDLERENYRSSFNLAYDPDLWGGKHRQLEASSAQANATIEMLDWQRLGVATEVARQYFLVQGLDAQTDVLTKTIQSRQRTLDLQTNKANAGLIDNLSTHQARTELELARNDLAVVERQRGSAEHALAVLSGSAPSEFKLPHQTIQNRLPTIRPGLPADVLNRRPDVRAAELALRAANAQIGVAEAAFYPQFNLMAAAGLESLDARQFLSWENRILSLGAGVAAPIFDGGSNRARWQAAVSHRDEVLANYRTTLLTALREVEDALVDLKGMAQSRQALENARSSAKETQRLANDRYDKGLSSFLEVVEADRNVLRIELVLVLTDAQQRITHAALAKALGGGWRAH